MNHHDHAWIAHAQARGPVIANGEHATLIAWKPGKGQARVMFTRNGAARSVPCNTVEIAS